MTTITFLTDFGLQDDFVGTCHGVIAMIAPEARVIDLTHGIDPQAVLQGALVLRNAVKFAPVGVSLAVVDPDGAQREVTRAHADASVGSVRAPDGITIESGRAEGTPEGDNTTGPAPII